MERIDDNFHIPSLFLESHEWIRFFNIQTNVVHHSNQTGRKGYTYNIS